MLNKTMRLKLFVMLVAVLAVSCTSEGQSVLPGSAACETLTEENADDCLSLNQIQVLGTHNSYKLDVLPELAEELDEYVPGWSRDLEYGHRTLTEQLDELAIRKFEFDVFADPDGGLFAEPSGAVLVDDTPFIRPDEMLEPGFKVLHVQDVDYRSHCLTLTGCLEEIRNWSVENSNHLPIMIMIELKDGSRDGWGPISFVKPVTIDDSNIYEVDAEIWSVFSRGHVITPGDVRGAQGSLEEAILADGWPSLAESRGKVLFALDNTGRHRDAYLIASPDLGRAMFVSTHPGEPTAGFIKMNNALDESDLIQEYTEQGYLIRTRSDIPTAEARSGSTIRRDLALGSGAHFVSTDYPEASPFGSGYIVELPGAEGSARCNPISAPEGCRNEWIVE